MKVLVTGGAGFIGSNLCSRLLAAPEVTEVVSLDDLSTGQRENLAGLPVRAVEASILDDAALDSSCAGADAIVHLAAIPSVPRSLAHPVASHAANATGTLLVLEAARRHDVGQVILASSSSVYGANPTLPKSENLRCEPMSPYAVSKLAAESYALAYARCFDLAVLPFRFFNVFGPGQPAGHAYAAVVPAFVAAALDGRPLPVYGDGRQSRDFTYVRTVADLITQAVLRRVSVEEPVNLAFGSRTTLLDLIEIIESALGHPLERDHLPGRAGDVPHSQADDTRLRELFPEAEAVPLADGIAETVAWFRGQRGDNLQPGATIDHPTEWPA